jgi:SAM-dependent methyltransferase
MVVPPEVYATARDTIGAFFEPIARVTRDSLARDFLDISKARSRAQLLERYVQLRGSKLLEIGSGFGTNLVAWTLDFGIDGCGVEPSSNGFDSGFMASRQLLQANGIDPERIIDAAGEHLPFADEMFDIVYSANVLEHTNQPEIVLAEAIRVLRRGGTLHVEVPNHLSYFEGHYLIPQPPLFDRRILPAWVSLLGRDPAFSRTLRTQINPNWCRRVLRDIAKIYPLDVISLGDDIFLERLAVPFKFETKGVASRLAPIIRIVQACNRWNWMGKLIVAARGYYPLYLTIRRR